MSTMSKESRDKITAALKKRWARVRKKDAAPAAKGHRNGAISPRKQAETARKAPANPVPLAGLRAASAALDATLAGAAQRGGVRDVRTLPAKEQAALAAGGGYQLIPVDSLQRCPTNRTVDREDGEYAAQRESVREHGILQPLRARPVRYAVATNASNKYQVVTIVGEVTRYTGPAFDKLTEAEREAAKWTKTKPAFELVIGERRWTIAREIHLAAVPVIVAEMTDRQAEIAQLTENLRRKGLSPMDEARGYKRLQDEGLSIPEIGKEMGGIGKTVIYARLALLGLPAEVIAATESGKLSASHAELLTRVDDEGEQKKLAEKILHPKPQDSKENGVLSVRRTAELVEDAKEEIDERKKWEAYRGTFSAAQKHITVLGFDESAKLMPWHHAPPQGFQRLDQCCYEDPKRRTFETLLRKNDIAQTICRDPDGKPVRLVLAKEVPAAIKAAGYEFKVTGSNEVPKGSDAEKDKARAKRERAKVNRAIFPAAIAEAVTVGTRLGWTTELARYLAGQEIGRLRTRHAETIVKRRGWEETNAEKWTMAKILDAHAKDMNAKECLGLLLEIMLVNREPDDFGDQPWGDGFEELCAAVKVDAKAVEKRFRTVGKGTQP